MSPAKPAASTPAPTPTPTPASPASETPKHRRRQNLIAGGVLLAAAALAGALSRRCCDDRDPADPDPDAQDKLSPASAVVDKLVAWARDAAPPSDSEEETAADTLDANRRPVSVFDFVRTQSV